MFDVSYCEEWNHIVYQCKGLRKSLTSKKIRIEWKFLCSYDQQINCVFVHQMLIYCECHPTNNLLNKGVLGFLFFQRKNHFWYKVRIIFLKYRIQILEERNRQLISFLRFCTFYNTHNLYNFLSYIACILWSWYEL